MINVSQGETDEKNRYNHQFETYQRKETQSEESPE